MTYTDTTDKNYPNYQTYYGAVINNPLFQMWQKEAKHYGIDIEESIETGWMSDMHFTKFLEWVVNMDSLEQFFILAHPDLREITFHSNGDVIIKTGANATNPKKLYSGRPPRNADGSLKEQPDWSNQIKTAIHKLLKDKNDALKSLQDNK